MNKNKFCGLSVAVGMMTTIGAGVQGSQANDGSETLNMLEEIVVTARKREEVVNDIPASLQVFGNKELESMGVSNVSDLQWITPGLSVPGGGRASIAIRGISNNISGIGSDPSAAVHFDGVYVPRPSLVLVESYDLNRIEVLKGPEGTLYGRNATAGVVNYISKAPSRELGAEGFVGVGSFNLRHANVAFDLPLGERGGIRVSGAYAKDDGYTKIIDGATITPDLGFLSAFIEPGSPSIDNRDFQSFRMRGEYELSDTVSMNFSVQNVADNGLVGRGQSHNVTSAGLATALGGGAQRINPRLVSLDPVIARDLDGFLASLTIQAELGGVTVRSITGYVDFKDNLVTDNDGTGIYIERGFGAETSEFISQELQLSGDFSVSGFWTGGLYFSKEDMTQTALLVDSFDAPGDVLFARFSTEAQSKSFAVFAELTYDLTSKLTATVGTRYTSESKDGTAEGENFNFGIWGTIPYSGTADIDDNAFTPKFALQYSPNDDHLIYASVTKGFKSGGYNPDNPVTTYNSETIWAYEIGTKSSFADGKVNLTAAAFYYDYKDIQLRTAFFPPGGGAFVRITNAASAEITGAELGLDAELNNSFSIDFGLSYLSNSVEGYIPPGETETVDIDLPQAPKWQGAIGINFKAPVGSGNISARAEYTFQSEIVFSPNSQDIAREEAIGLINANVRYDFPNNRFYVTVIGRNIVNKTYLTNRFFFAGFSDLETYAAPRQIEFRVGASF